MAVVLCLAFFVLAVLQMPSAPVSPSGSFFTSAAEITRGDTSKKQVIFTFDGGSGVNSAQTILDVLNKHHVKGTFFLTGLFVKEYPEIVKKILAGGNEIFNHTYDHVSLTTLGDREIVQELEGMSHVFHYVTGGDARPFFRPPSGDRDTRVLQAAAMSGYRSVFWTVDALDWQEENGVTAHEVKERIYSTLAPGNIYLMHIGDNITGGILDEIFREVESRGYKIVSLTQGL